MTRSRQAEALHSQRTAVQRCDPEQSEWYLREADGATLAELQLGKQSVLAVYARFQEGWAPAVSHHATEPIAGIDVFKHASMHEAKRKNCLLDNYCMRDGTDQT